MTLQLHDTRTAQLRPFGPLGPQPIGLYVCGITPYDSGHLGHAFTYVHFDVLNRYLRYLGHRVTYVQNLTDVDDDMLRKARELGEDYLELGDRYVERFFAEMGALNWLPPDRYPRATQHIEAMQRLIERLIERGHAYAAEGNVYFEIDTFPAYGTFSGIPRDEMLPIANERGNVPEMPGKRDPLDFVLWQRSGPDEPSWPSPWGPGRPGWHVECSAMSMSYLGERFEIHGGGSDLVFPHHESEIAQSEAATGQRPFVDFWLHTGMVHHDGDKMSKSLGNLVLVADLLRSHPAAAVRHYLMTHHYRSELEYDSGRLRASVAEIDHLRRACAAVEADPYDAGQPDPSVAGLRNAFLAAMDADLDTPVALRALGGLASIALDASGSREARAQAAWQIGELGGRILGLDFDERHDREALATLGEERGRGP